MAIGKNKNLGKKKGGKKKTADAFSKKEWYHVKAPAVFPVREIGRTVVTKSSGTKLAKDSLVGRCFDVSLGDLKPHGEDDAYRKFRLRVQGVNGNQCLTVFHGMSLAREKLCSLVRKWQTLIEAHTDINTSDGYRLRLFCIGFTRAQPNQNRKTSYAQSAQVRQIRRRMIEIMKRETAACDITQLVQKLIPEIIGKEIEKVCQGIYPLSSCYIRKVKVLRAPKPDIQRLMDLHGGVSAINDMGVSVERPEETEEKEALIADVEES